MAKPLAIAPLPLDPWAHRSSGMRCSTCMWFAAKGELGRCRRHVSTLGGYLAVFPDDWCGDHKLDETKLAPRAAG